MHAKKVILIDGGLSTELNELGLNLNDSKLWTGNSILKNPDVLKQAHINFLKNGSDIIETASYQLSIPALQSELNCSVQEARSIIKQSVRIAHEARQISGFKDALIAGSVGPYGACLCDGSEFKGDYVNYLSVEDLKEWHRPRLECLLEENCDLIAFETIPSIKEASVLLSLLSEYSNSKAWLSFSCKDETSLCNGDAFKDAYEKFKDNDQLVAIGVNCTYPKYIKSLLQSVARNEELTKPFIVYPNDAKEWDEQQAKYVSHEEDPFEIVLGSLKDWIDLGARYIGGCCNINSKHIKLMHSFLIKL